MKKNFGLFFSRDIEHDKCQVAVYKGSQGILTIFVQLIWTYIWHIKDRLKQTFQKTAVFTMKEVFGPFSFVLSRVTNLKEQFIMVHKLFWQLLWKLIELIEHFFWDLTGCWKHKFLRKKGDLSSEEKILAYFFLVISNMTNVREELIRAHKVFRHFFCNWYEHIFGT